MDPGLRDQIERWKRFEAWENDQLRAASRDFSATLAWMSEAWDLASRLDPSWGSRERAERHWRQLTNVQRKLARAFAGS